MSQRHDQIAEIVRADQQFGKQPFGQYTRGKELVDSLGISLFPDF